MIIAVETFGMMVGMCFLCLGCVLDQNKKPFLVSFREFVCLLNKHILKNISLVEFQSYNPELQPNEKFLMVASEARKRKAIDYIMKLTKHFLSLCGEFRFFVELHKQSPSNSLKVCIHATATLLLIQYGLHE